MHEVFRKLLRPDWSKLDVHTALRCVPGIALPLLLGFATGHVRQGVMAASGAFSVGFGAFYEILRSRRLAMLVAALGMAVSSWVGAVSGSSTPACIAVAGIWGLVYGVVSDLSVGASWVSLMWVIWLVISTASPLHGLHALARAGFILLGGVLQALFVDAQWQLSRLRHPLVTPPQLRLTLRALRENAHYEAYRVQTAMTLMIAMGIARWTQMPNNYWIPMTAAIVLRPVLADAVEIGLMRLAGTMLGAVLASAVAQALHPGMAGLAILVVVFAFASYLFVFVNYTYFAVALTPYIVFLLELSGLPEDALIKPRALHTLLGGTIAIVSQALLAWLVPGPPRRVHA